jgi:hypothetical protein
MVNENINDPTIHMESKTASAETPTGGPWVNPKPAGPTNRTLLTEGRSRLLRRTFARRRR